jgi:SsrA-binding protein
MATNTTAALAPTVDNRKARYDYEIIESFEVGIALSGTEVKSIRNGTVGLREAYGKIRNNEVFLVGLHIPMYKEGSFSNHEPRRERKLLLHKKEILRITQLTAEKGLALVPLRLYFTRGRVKIQLAIGRGKKSWDKRRAIADRESRRDLARFVR